MGNRNLLCPACGSKEFIQSGEGRNQKTACRRCKRPFTQRDIEAAGVEIGKKLFEDAARKAGLKLK